jgi:hypothetical protein
MTVLMLMTFALVIIIRTGEHLVEVAKHLRSW